MLDTFQAAILLEKLEIFDKELEFRNQVATYYTGNINSDLMRPYAPKEYISSWVQYSLLANSESDKTKIMLTLKESNNPSMIYYRIPFHLQSVFETLEYASGDFPASEEVSSQIFSIPMHPYLTRDQQNEIIGVLNNG